MYTILLDYKMINHLICISNSVKDQYDKCQVAYKTFYIENLYTRASQ